MSIKGTKPSCVHYSKMGFCLLYGASCDGCNTHVIANYEKTTTDSKPAVLLMKEITIKKEGKNEMGK